MLAVNLPVNIFILGAIVIAAFLAGFLLRSRQLKSHKKKVLELENEMLRNHAEILDIQKEKSQLEQRLKESAIPVISMSTSKDEANAKELRKMAQSSSASKHS